MAQDWDIKARGEACAGCQTNYADGQAYYASLVFSEEGYARADYCENCWNARAADGRHYSIWRGVFKMPPPPQYETLKKETAESLLRKLMEDEDESKINVIYILAVMLERKKILVERDVQMREDGQMIRVYEHKATGETFIIPDPRLKLNELEKVQEEVVVMLGGTIPKGKGRGEEDGNQKSEDRGQGEEEDGDEEEDDDEEDEEDEEDDDEDEYDEDEDEDDDDDRD